MGLSKLQVLNNQFNVAYDYDVIFTNNVFSVGNTNLRDSLTALTSLDSPTKVLVTIDSGLADAQPQLARQVKTWLQYNNDVLTLVDEPLVLPGGEVGKNDFDATLKTIRAARATHLCHHSFIFAIGGGAMLDVVGFAASMIHRGVRIVRFPTTVLSQNDSGVGVKNGVNLRGVKNFLGTFAPPALVVNDFSFLDTLSNRDWSAGTAEAFKVAIIKDESFLDWLIENAPSIPERDSATMKYLVERCAELHVEHIRTAGDPFEFGNARPLDFGHWAAHKLESLSLNEINHGEAVAIGMSIDLLCAARLGFIKQKQAETIVNAIKLANLPIWSDILAMTDIGDRLLVLNGIEEFREHLGGKLYLTMPKPLGRKIEINELPENVVISSIEYLKKIDKQKAFTHQKTGDQLKNEKYIDH
jgi:3-dehydroquinate synthase